ncbi:leucine-rich repeat-containing protein 34 isoform X6 [Ambystoma mexicanum]|uniref:leucine-rich repeat-containing protein 34 isoform X6 n=1 Tax=Ambystoma mexicanum TaxID=8296 RepID=UPI0037E823C5
MVRGAQRGAPVYSRDPRKVMSSTSNHEIVDVCPTQIQPISHYMTEMVQVDQESALKVMTSPLKLRYLDVCAELNQPVNPFIAEMLQVDLEYVPSSSIIKIAGNNRLMPVKRVTDNDTMVLAKVLANNTFVKGLDLRFNTLTDTGAEHIGKLLQVTPALSHLNLMGNDIGAEGAEFIARALHRNETLKSLKMTGNKIENTGAMHFAAMLQINSSLEELDLGDCDLHTQSLIALATVLIQNRTIKSLNVNRPILYSLQEEVTIHFSGMLEVNYCLQELHLSKHEMSDVAVERLCEGLERNFTLRFLDLSCNRITCDGVKCLATLLKQNTALEILDLSSNRMEDDGAMHLGDALSMYNNNLKALAVVSNNITGKGLVPLSNAIKTNSTLSYVYIWGNKLDEASCVAFADLLNTGRLTPECTDVEPYVVDGRVYLAELFHGLRKHYYWTPSYGVVDHPISNSSLPIRADYQSFSQD